MSYLDKGAWCETYSGSHQQSYSATAAKQCLYELSSLVNVLTVPEPDKQQAVHDTTCRGVGWQTCGGVVRQPSDRVPGP